jgi:hypothetical protein
VRRKFGDLKIYEKFKQNVSQRKYCLIYIYSIFVIINLY